MRQNSWWTFDGSYQFQRTPYQVTILCWFRHHYTWDCLLSYIYSWLDIVHVETVDGAMSFLTLRNKPGDLKWSTVSCHSSPSSVFLSFIKKCEKPPNINEHLVSLPSKISYLRPCHNGFETDQTWFQAQKCFEIWRVKAVIWYKWVFFKLVTDIPLVHITSFG